MLLTALTTLLLSNSNWFTSSSYLIIMLMGWVTAQLQDPSYKSTYYQHQASCTHWLVQVQDQPKATAELISFTGALVGCSSVTGSQPITGKLKLYLKPSYYQSTVPLPGDKVAFTAKLSSISPPRNPYEFDYQAYLARQHTHHQVYLYPKQYRILPDSSFNLRRLAAQLRKEATNRLHTALKDTTYTALASSMLLGDRNLLDNQLKSNFAITGAMHVLAISGLHVGIVALLLVFVLDRLWPEKRSWVKAIIIVVCLAGYAFITGLSPSVLRASVMFSFLLLGKAINRKANPYNSLAASAILLLMLDPTMIQQLGFWLSYSAVVGIFLIYPKLYGWLYFKNRLANWVWQLLAVSLAAQIATLPITIYSFHQLPTYSLLTNLIVVPATTLILGIGLGYLALSWIPWLGATLAFLLKLILQGVILSVNWLAQLPLSGIKGIYISLPEFLLYIGGISFVVLWMHRGPRAGIIIRLTGLIILLTGFSLYRDFQNHQQKSFTIYSLYEHTVLDIFHGRHTFSYQDSTLATDSLLVERKVWPNRYAHGIISQQSLPAPAVWSFTTDGCTFIQVAGNRIAIIGKTNRKNLPAKTIPLDHVLLTDNCPLNVRYVDQLFQSPTIIFDRSNTTTRIKKWLTSCESLPVNCYNAREFAFTSTL